MAQIYRMVLVEICKEIDGHDMASLRYLTQDVISLADLEKCKIAIDIFTLLENDKNVPAMKRIVHYLTLMEKPSLVRMLGLDPGTTLTEVENDITTVDLYRKALFNVAENLSTEEVDKLIAIAENRLPNIIPAIRKLEKMEAHSRAYGLFNILEKRQDISSKNCSLLYQMLEHIKRTDLHEYIECFTVFEESEEHYAMNAEIRGFCVIINNEEFIDKDAFPDRPGSQRDVDALSNTFKQLKYNIVVKKNLTAEQVIAVCNDLSGKDHTSFNALVVCVLSHGRERLVYGVDGGQIYIRNITDMFIGARCGSLSGKPKLFFIQACQGTKEQIILTRPRTRQSSNTGRDIQCLPPEPMSVDEDPQANVHLDERQANFAPDEPQANVHLEEHQADVDPDESDILLGYSTVSGYYSYRNATAGSWYIQILCQQINIKYQSYHLMDILTEVNNQLSKVIIPIDEKRVKTTPMQQSTLRRPVYFFPENIR